VVQPTSSWPVTSGLPLTRIAKGRAVSEYARTRTTGSPASWASVTGTSSLAEPPVMTATLTSPWLCRSFHAVRLGLAQVAEPSVLGEAVRAADDEQATAAGDVSGQPVVDQRVGQPFRAAVGRLRRGLAWLGRFGLVGLGHGARAGAAATGRRLLVGLAAQHEGGEERRQRGGAEHRGHRGNLCTRSIAGQLPVARQRAIGAGYCAIRQPWL
jgi:hypothetical protein